MSRLPLLISVPHAGIRIPDEVRDICVLSPRQVKRDGDKGAAEIYAFRDTVEVWLSTSVARAIVDLNRAEDDRRKDGVVKTHTCWDVPVYSSALSDELAEVLINRYHRPYHRRLTELVKHGVRLGVDCHTMAANAPPVTPEPGRERPEICISNSDGSCPDDWVESLAQCFKTLHDELDVRINDPFRGGYIIRSHASELPWVQIELSRAPFLSNSEKKAWVLAALERFCSMQSW